jgi:hypothetical protein
MVRTALPKCFFAEVHVVRHKYLIFVKGHFDDGFVSYSAVLIVYGNDVVSRFSKPLRDCRPGTFVHNETHQERPGTCGMNWVLSSDLPAKR